MPKSKYQNPFFLFYIYYTNTHQELISSNWTGGCLPLLKKLESKKYSPKAYFFKSDFEMIIGDSFDFIYFD